MNKKELTKEKEQLKLYIDNMFYDEELENYTEDEQELKKRIKDIIDTINNFDDNELYTKKELIIKNAYFILILGHCVNIDKDPYLFSEERLNELITEYDNITKCISTDGLEKTIQIVKDYGDVITKDSNGFYYLDDTIVNKVIDDNEFYISDKDDKQAFKEEIFNTWENQKEILTQKSLNEYSEKRNGINFKHFIFCEEYIKRGKIKPTCEHLGISRNTAYTWLKDKKVQDYLASRKEEIKQETDNTFLNTYRACFNELNEMIANDNWLDTNDKLKAIDIFLRHYANLERIKQPNTTYED